MSVTSQDLVIRTLELSPKEELLCSTYPTYSYPITPPSTPPKTPTSQLFYSPTTSYAPNFSNSSPTIHIHTPKPWYATTHFTIITVSTLAFAAFGLHSLSPLIQSTSSTITSFGNVVGSVANMGNAIGDSVAHTNRVTFGIADGLGDVWCSVFGGKGCGYYGEMPDAPQPGVSGLGTNALLEGAKVVNSLKELADINTNLSASGDLLSLSEFLTQAPLIDHVAAQWSDRLRLASPAYFKNLQAKQSAFLRTTGLLQGLVDQYNTAVLVAKAPSSILDAVIDGRHARRELLNIELSRMAKHTYLSHGQARSDLEEVFASSENLYNEGTHIISQAKKKLALLVKERKMHPLWEVVCAIGSCNLQELDWTINLLRLLIDTLEGPTMDSAKRTQAAQKLIYELDILISAFNATAGVEPRLDGHVVVGSPKNPWLTLTRLEPGLSDLSVRLKDLK